MSATAVGLLVAACVFAGGLLGLNANRLLPKHHLTTQTLEVVRLSTGTISVLASLVLGLLIATAKTASDTTDRELRGYAADLITLDDALRAYGSDAAMPRLLLRRSTARTVQDVWPKPGGTFAGLDEASAGALLSQAEQVIRALVPADAGQRWRQDQAQQIAASLVRQRWILVEQAGPTVHPVILGVLVCWVVVIFVSIGLNAPRNGTVVAAFLVCALAIGGAVFLILEMDSPFSGVLRLSDAPMQRALAHMGR